jgi:DNA gyrase/topoisomerase IV subunit B
MFLIKSLGFICKSYTTTEEFKYQGRLNKGEVININIYGNGIEDIPTKIATKKSYSFEKGLANTGILKIKKIEDGEYVGLSVDGNQRFVLEDFTVTHNCNVFSTSFRVRGVDPNNNKMLIQEWTNNMKNTNGPIVSDSVLKKGYTEITWTPDFSQFGMKKYSQDIINLYTRYVIDAAMLSKVDVFLNNEIIPINNLSLYSKLYDTPTNNILAIKTNTSDVVITPSTEFQAISFVNGIYTRLGGQHVDAWSEAIFRPIVNKFNKKGKPQLTIKDIKQFFRIFVCSTVINPEFESQNKDKLENPPISVAVKKSHIDSICKWDIMESIEDIIRSKEMIVLRKSERKKKGFVKIEGLDPANNAGGSLSSQCTLILCEGLSAKTYAVAGIEKGVYGKSGRDWFGIYPLRGKVLNVRNASPTVIAKNTVITDLIQALGIKHDVDYTDNKNFEQLRYGKIMIMTDADSVTGDTPILVKNTNGLINVKNIEDLCTTWVGNDKEYGLSDYTVWTECGWSNIKSVMKHKVSKRIYRVVTHTGIVDVTEDHSLLKEDGVKITPQECVVGQTLLHSFPVFSENKPDIPNNLTELKVKDLRKYASQCKIQYYQTMKKKELIDNIINVCNKYDNMQILSHINVTIEEAYVMGLFFTDGSCGIYESKYHKRPLNKPKTYTFNRISYSWTISNTNLNYLEKARDILCNIYGFDFKIIDDHNNETRRYQNIYKLSLNGGKKVKHFIENYRKLFYSGQSKTIPEIILNAPTKVRENFFQGMYDGDGDKSTGVTRIDVYKKIGAQAVFLLCKSLGYEVSINCREDKPDVFTVCMTKEYQQINPHMIKKLIDLGTTEQYVYDIETDNHHFQAGIGQIIVHNTDGLHIEALIMNFFHSLFPTLYERSVPFIVSMKTPIVRVFRPKGDLLFYDERKFKEFVTTQTKSFKKKYYKGLGTTKPEDVPDTFGLKIVEYINDENTSFNMNKVFHKKHADSRKDWLAEYTENSSFSLDDNGEIIQMEISSFINGEMIKFSHDDCKRSIPNGIDGLKESQRKILFSVMKKKLKYSGPSLKVAQLGGYTAEHTNYHHGEQNLFETITKMANEFPGSNNIPLLYRDGQFGTRLSGGKDAASPRYIYTKMDMLTHLLFREEDFPLLDLVTDDGDTVEPVFYVPILPMILINGCSGGIGTGWSCNVPCYNPLDLISCIKVWLDNDGEVFVEDPDTHTIISLLPEIHPWYRDFKGTIEPNGTNRYITYGILEKESRNKVIVSELPIGMWTDKFKEICEEYVEEKQLKSMKNYSTPKNPHFILTESSDGFSCSIETLKLHSYLYTSNMVLFNENEKLRKFTNIDEIIHFFCTVRFNYYIKRKKYIIQSLETEHRYLGNKARFIQEVIDEELLIMNEEENSIIKELEERGYDKDNTKSNLIDGEEIGAYDYLLRMQVRTFTANKVKQLKNDIASLQEKIDGIKSITEKQMWINDLNEFQKEYIKWLKIINNSTPKNTKKK